MADPTLFLTDAPDDAARSVIGSRLLCLAEEEGAQRGCRSAMLYTISFQAPGFYERHGWREFGRIPCDPPGTARIFMTKALAAPAPAVRS
ncbi:MAG: GNAT family N-acetyltransferase [Reyranella sp.]|nr:GNAT family N-acetyltransferase [Reyranella sp.]